MKVETSIVINRPLDEVFAFTADVENQPQWQSRLIEARKTSVGPIGVGTTWSSVAKFLGQRIELETVTTDYEPNRTYAAKSTSGPFPVLGRQSYEAVAGGTQIKVTLEWQPSGFFKVAEPLLATMLKRQTETDLINLKDLMEAHAL